MDRKLKTRISNCGNVAFVTGTSVAVPWIVARWKYGLTDKAILESCSQLTQEDLRAVAAYFDENKEEILIQVREEP